MAPSKPVAQHPDYFLGVCDVLAIVGVPIGVLCGTFDSCSKFFEPVIDFISGYTPAPAFSGLCLAMFASDDGPKIAIIWIGTFFQMVLVVANTTRLMDIGLLEAAQTLGATRARLVTRVIIPGIFAEPLQRHALS